MIYIIDATELSFSTEKSTSISDKIDERETLYLLHLKILHAERLLQFSQMSHSETAICKTQGILKSAKTFTADGEDLRNEYKMLERKLVLTFQLIPTCLNILQTNKITLLMLSLKH